MQISISFLKDRPTAVTEIYIRATSGARVSPQIFYCCSILNNNGNPVGICLGDVGNNTPEGTKR
jgi:hypothetical protein